MIRGLTFRLLQRRPNLTLTQPAIFNYTFLQSQNLHQRMVVDPEKEYHKKISMLIESNFDEKDLMALDFMNEEIKVQKALKQTIGLSLRKNKDHIFKDLELMASHNILQTQLWTKVFQEVLDRRFVQLQHHPDFGNVFRHFCGYVEKFGGKQFKFVMPKTGLGLTLPMGEQSSGVYRRKDPTISNISVQNNLIAFFTKISSKTLMDFRYMRKYYVENMIDNLERIIDKEPSLLEVVKLESSLAGLGLLTEVQKDIFTAKINSLMADSVDLSSRDCNVIVSNWTATGELRRVFTSYLPVITDALIVQNPVLLLQGLLLNKEVSPQLIDRVIDEIKLTGLAQQTRKAEIHRAFHVLAIRGHDLSKHSDMINKLSKDVCEKLHPKLATIIPRNMVKSPCMVIGDRFTRFAAFFPRPQMRWVGQVLNDHYGLKLHSLNQVKLCRFDILFGFIKNRKVYVVQIPSLDLILNKVVNYRGTVMMKEQVFEHYGVEIVKVDIDKKRLQQIIKSKNINELTELIDKAIAFIL